MLRLPPALRKIGGEPPVHPIRQNFLYVRVAPPAIRWRSQECLLSLSWRDITYEPENGKLRIPAAAPEAVSHGFVGIPEEE